MTELSEENQREIVDAIGRCERRAAEAEAKGKLDLERYWEGVVFGILYGMRKVFGDPVADRIAAEVMEPGRAKNAAVPS